ncbi:MAG: NAD-dependent succinate-semialdehyde dehydrogenase [Methylobacteriaceae bacterium]|nr:NAD-dependent succinate-semialdehyde dehydrogenase [Methylobacteriaceae bacterium]MBV9245879.1 NAD-dependent succinate-semialdehyde dehydrogenase [Methylobacteriaceae bacterium]MBV9635784.1 NAD-dependent succinate-semialdehyde dehydrogenase [Methylobacteriaceae bacterium]
MYEPLHLFIDGKWRAGSEGKTEPVRNPANGEVLGALPHASRTDLDEALAAADRGFRTWKATSPYDRERIIRKAADLLRERVDRIAPVLTLEQGKPIGEARIEVAFAADVMQWFAEEGRRAYGRIVPGRNPNLHMKVVREPVGPVAAFTAWNFPATVPARKISAALAAGCSCIIKPSEETPGTALAVARAFEDAGLPAGVLQVVFGVPPEISGHLLRSPVIRKVTLTGSIPVGKTLARLAADGLKVLTLELGGHAPVIVDADSNPTQAAELAVAAKFRNAGQVCISPTRFFVHDSIMRDFVSRFADLASALKVGDGMDPATQMGPLANPRRVEAVESMVEDAVAQGARVVTGGKRVGNIGNFYAPTVLSGVPDAARMMREEPFGPVAPINSFTSLDEAVDRSNALPYGLAAYVFTRSADRAQRLSERLDVGLVGLNSYVVAQPEIPFGGVKDSGYGRESGIEGLGAFMVDKTITQLVA